MDKPKQRSQARIFFGRIFYWLKKMFYWHFSNTTFAKQRKGENILIKIFEHKTPLFRNLEGDKRQLQKNKIQNLSLAIRELDKVVIEPGETFSYWKLIGNPTQKKGYVDGMILKNGKVESGVGGGLCQLSNLIFWMALHTPLTITERWRHGYDVFPDANRTQPFGSGATCAYPNIDLQITNKTNQPFQLNLHLTKTHLVGSWTSTEAPSDLHQIVERDHAMASEWWGGHTRHNRIIKQRVDKQTRTILEEEVVAENHAIMMYAPFIDSEK